jgi:hypothetical protein
LGKSWEEKASELIRVELGKQLLTNKKFVELLNQSGMSEDETGVSRKLSKGTFKLSWGMQVMDVIGLELTVVQKKANKL